MDKTTDHAQAQPRQTSLTPGQQHTNPDHGQVRRKIQTDHCERLRRRQIVAMANTSEDAQDQSVQQEVPPKDEDGGQRHDFEALPHGDHDAEEVNWNPSEAHDPTGADETNSIQLKMLFHFQLIYVWQKNFMGSNVTSAKRDLIMPMWCFGSKGEEDTDCRRVLDGQSSPRESRQGIRARGAGQVAGTSSSPLLRTKIIQNNKDNSLTFEGQNRGCRGALPTLTLGVWRWRM